MGQRHLTNVYIYDAVLPPAHCFTFEICLLLTLSLLLCPMYSYIHTKYLLMSVACNSSALKTFTQWYRWRETSPAYSLNRGQQQCGVGQVIVHRDAFTRVCLLFCLVPHGFFRLFNRIHSARICVMFTYLHDGSRRFIIIVGHVLIYLDTCSAEWLYNLLLST